MENNTPETTQPSVPVPEPKPEPTLPKPPEQTTPPKSKKWLIPVLIIITVLALVTAGYFAYQNNLLIQEISQTESMPSPIVNDEMFHLDEITPPSSEVDATADWETFADIDNKFSFKYPSILKEESSSAENTYYLETEGYKPYTTDQYQIQISVLLASNLMTTNEFINRIKPNTPDYDTLEKQEKILINGHESVVKTNKSIVTEGIESSANRKSYYIYSPNVGVLLASSGPTADHTMFDQILSTFKFTE